MVVNLGEWQAKCLVLLTVVRMGNLLDWWMEILLGNSKDLLKAAEKVNLKDSKLV